ncbi:winged helix-turn-helix transcriptional regulator [Pelagibius sp.]|uniref:winged helix-turn-helix transcriptional regulator n=1 Tax=Pelagibius sp. TaxID=1931238 RepID=UPI003BB151D6
MTSGSVTRGYGQYCPLALACEVLGERWAILVMSRLIDGCRRFNEIHRGVPRMSASLLSQRLAQLEAAGMAERRPLPGGHGYSYEPSEAGWELEPIIMELAAWGQRWARDMTAEDLDPGFLVWSMHERINTAAMPPDRTVLAFEFTGAPRDSRRFWLVNTDGKVEMCLKDPGYEVDVKVMSDLRLFIDAWRGFRSLRREIAGGAIRLEGPTELKRALPRWLMLSALAPFERRRPDKERDLAKKNKTAKVRA